jgi:hypothetical protein
VGFPLFGGILDGLLRMLVNKDVCFVLEVPDPVGDTIVVREEVGVKMFGSSREPLKEVVEGRVAWVFRVVQRSLSDGIQKFFAILLVPWWAAVATWPTPYGCEEC